MTTPPATRFRRVYLEIGNLCNLHCSFCPGTVRRPATMSLDLFRRCLDQVRPFTEQVYFHVMGEPLLHPDFAACVELCRGVGLAVNITTNGTRLDLPGRVEALLNPAVRQVNFSMHALAMDEAALGRVLSFAGRALRERPDLYINFRFWNLLDVHGRMPEANVGLLNRIAEALEVTLPPLHFSIDSKSFPLRQRIYLHLDTVFDWIENPGRPPRQDGRCLALTDQLAVLADGTVVPCCLDHDGELALGNLCEQELTSILEGARAVAILEGFRRNRRIEPRCQHCAFVDRFKKKRKLQEG